MIIPGTGLLHPTGMSIADTFVSRKVPMPKFSHGTVWLVNDLHINVSCIGCMLLHRIPDIRNLPHAKFSFAGAEHPLHRLGKGGVRPSYPCY